MRNWVTEIIIKYKRQIMREDARNNGSRSNDVPQNNDSESDSERELDGNYPYESDC